jgi:hypothetical protein
MIWVVFASLADFLAFREAVPSALALPDTMIGEPAFESCDAEGTPLPGSRVFIAHAFTADECAILSLAGADVRVGAIDGPEFGQHGEI